MQTCADLIQEADLQDQAGKQPTCREPVRHLLNPNSLAF